MNKTDYHKKLCLDNNSRHVVEGKGRNVIFTPEEKPLWIGFLE